MKGVKGQKRWRVDLTSDESEDANESGDEREFVRQTKESKGGPDRDRLQDFLAGEDGFQSSDDEPLPKELETDHAAVVKDGTLPRSSTTCPTSLTTDEGVE